MASLNFPSLFTCASLWARQGLFHILLEASDQDKTLSSSIRLYHNTAIVSYLRSMGANYLNLTLHLNTHKNNHVW